MLFLLSLTRTHRNLPILELVCANGAFMMCEHDEVARLGEQFGSSWPVFNYGSLFCCHQMENSGDSDYIWRSKVLSLDTGDDYARFRFFGGLFGARVLPSIGSLFLKSTNCYD